MSRKRKTSALALASNRPGPSPQKAHFWANNHLGDADSADRPRVILHH